MKNLFLALSMVLIGSAAKADVTIDPAQFTLQQKKDTAIAALKPLLEKSAALKASAASVRGKFPKAGKHLQKAAEELEKAVIEMTKEVNALKEDSF